MKNLLLITLPTAAVFCVSSISGQVVFSTDFEGFTAGAANDYVKDFNISLAGDNTTGNSKDVVFGQWGMTNNGNDFAGGVAGAQSSGATNLKMLGVYIDPADFSATGAGNYTVSFDLTSDPGGNAAYRAYIFAGSGYDFTDISTDSLSLNLSAGGFPGFGGLSASGSATATELTEVILDAEATAGTVGSSVTSAVSFDFAYDGTSAIAFAIGGFNNASTIDNFSISVVPEPSIYGFMAGLLGLGYVVTRRRRS